MTTYSLVRQQGKKYSIPTTSNPNNHAQLIATTYASMLNIHITMGLPPVGKYYMCFQKEGKNAQDARCIKSRIMTNVIVSIISIDTFEQHCVVLNGMLQSPRMKDHV